MRGSPFFENVRQIELEMGGESGRMPVFYYDCTAMTAVFPARYGALKRLMPDPRFVPARLAPGLGSVVISALEYRDSDIGSYNELMIGVLLNAPGRTNFPGRGIVDSFLAPTQNHAFIVHLPVTTSIAFVSGVDFYNFPKFLADIDFAEQHGSRSCRLADSDGSILTLAADPIQTPRSARSSLFCHLYMDGQPQCAEVKMNALETGTCRRLGAMRLELSDRHPVAQKLDRVLVSRRSVHCELTPRMEAILFGPEHLTIPLLHSSLHAVELAASVPITRS